MAKNETSFKPGESGNPNGRPKGSKNKTTAEIREAIQQVLSKKIDDLETDLEKMSEFKAWTILNAVAKYALPTLNKNENLNDNSGEINLKITYTDSESPAESNSDEAPDNEPF